MKRHTCIAGACARVASIVLLIALVGSGCAFTRIQRPLDEDFDKTELGTKTGRSHITSVLWLFAWGDGGTGAAARNGDIKVIRHADRQVFALLLGLYSRVTTIVYGD